ARYVAVNNITEYVAKVVNDSSPQVRREAAIALKYVGTEAAAELWADLASQYVAGDRWQLEALGIGSDRYPDLYFDAWKKKVGDEWNSPAGSEIIWRSGAGATVPLLAELIKDKNVSPEKLPSYFRAFHFKKHPQKNEILFSLLTLDHPQSKLIKAYALGQLDDTFVNSSAKNIQIVKNVLPQIEGTAEWLMAVKKLNIKGQETVMFNMVSNNGDKELRKEAAGLLFAGGGNKIVSAYLNSDVSEASKLQMIDVLGSINEKKATDFLEKIVLEDKLSFPLMRKTIESMGNSWDGQHKLYALLETGKLKEEYKTIAVIKLMGSWSSEIRENAPKYLAASADDKVAVADLIELEGDPIAGKSIYATFCASCHIADGAGTDFGPGLSDIGNKLSRSFLYSSIIYPNVGINFGYE